MGGLVYDSSALVAAARGHWLAWRLHRATLERNEVPLVVAPALARAWGEAADRALLRAFLRGCAVADFPASAAQDAGLLLARSATTDVVAAAVVLAALTTRSAVVTADPDGVRALARILDVDLPVAAIGYDDVGSPSREAGVRVDR